MRTRTGWGCGTIFGLAIVLTGCSSGGDGITTDLGAGPSVAQTLSRTLQGVASLGGVVSGGTVTVVVVNADGTGGARLGTTTTGTDGSFSLTVEIPVDSSVRLEITGGTAIDTPTGKTVTVTAGILILDLPNPDQDRTGLQITPLTTLAHRVAKARAAKGEAVGTAIVQAHKEIGQRFGITEINEAGTVTAGDITTTPPSVGINATGAEQRYELALLALAQQAKNLQASPLAFLESLADDAEDGVFDGKKDGVTVIVITAGGIVDLSADATLSLLVTALKDFLASDQNETLLTEDSLVVAEITTTLEDQITAQSRVSEGRVLLFTDPPDLVGADKKFTEALVLNPNNKEAHLFRAVTRGPRLFQENVDGPDTTTFTDSFKEMLDRAGISAAGRDIFDFTADFVNKDTQGDVILPTDFPTGGDLQTFGRTVVVPEQREAIDDLKTLGCPTSGFKLGLTAAETQSTNSTEVDCGDVLVVLAMSKMQLANQLIDLSYDRDLDIDALADTEPEINDVLSANPALLTPTSDAVALLSEAKTLLIEAIDDYNAASTFIRTETDDQSNDVITIGDPEGTEAQKQEDLTEEQELRNDLADIKTSLQGTTTQLGDQTGPEHSINLSKFFTIPTDVTDGLRGLLPQFDASSEAISDTLPDPTFNGIWPDMTNTLWSD